MRERWKGRERNRKREREMERHSKKGKSFANLESIFFSVYPPPCGRLRVKKDIIENK